MLKSKTRRCITLRKRGIPTVKNNNRCHTEISFDKESNVRAFLRGVCSEKRERGNAVI